MATEGPQLVIELFAGTEDSPPRITIRSSAEAPTTIVPASVEDAPDYSQAPRKKVAQKEEGGSQEESRPEEEGGPPKAQEPGEAATATVAEPRERTAEEEGQEEEGCQEEGGQAGTGALPGQANPQGYGRGRECPTAELYREDLDKKWHLNVDGDERRRRLRLEQLTEAGT